MAARTYERGELFHWIHLPILEERNEEDKYQGDEENAERIQASGEGLSEFAAINNSIALAASTSTENCSTSTPDHWIAQGPQGNRKSLDQPKAARKAKKN